MGATRYAWRHIENMKHKQSSPEYKCPSCGRRADEGVTFALLRETNQLDKVCIKCRFNKIDSRAASPVGIRQDMIDSGVPVSRRRVGNAHRLRFGLPEDDPESIDVVDDPYSSSALDPSAARNGFELARNTDDEPC